MEPVVIIGGGVAGLSLAYHLGDENEVILVDKTGIGAETTSKATGVFDWYIHADEKDNRIVSRSWDVYRDLVDTGDLDFRTMGFMQVARSEEVMSTLEDHAAKLNEHGVDAKILGLDDIEEYGISPAVDTVGAIILPEMGRFDPQVIAQALADHMSSAGVDIRTGVEVTDILTSQGEVTGVQTTDGTIEAGIVINAAGPWANTVNEMVDISLPLKHYQQPMVVVEADEGQDLPIVVFDNGHYFVGYPFDVDPPRKFYAGYDPQESSDTGFFEEGAVTLNPDRDIVVDDAYREAVFELIDEYLPGLKGATEVDSYVCTPCLSPDGKPLAGETDVHGYYVMNGLSGAGITRSPGVASILAEHIESGESNDLLEYLSPNRFE